jgi:WD40 repeat protein
MEPAFVTSLATSPATSIASGIAGAVTVLELPVVPDDVLGTEVDSVKEMDKAHGFCRFILAGTSGGGLRLWKLEHSAPAASGTANYYYNTAYDGYASTPVSSLTTSTVLASADAHATRVAAGVMFTRSTPPDERSPRGSATAMMCTCGDDELVCLWEIDAQATSYETTGGDRGTEASRFIGRHDAWNGAMRRGEVYYPRIVQRVVVGGGSVPRGVRVAVNGHALIILAAQRIYALTTDVPAASDVGMMMIDGVEDDGGVTAADIGSLTAPITAVSPASFWVSGGTGGGAAAARDAQPRRGWDIALGTEDGQLVALTAKIVEEDVSNGHADDGSHTSPPVAQSVSFTLSRAKGGRPYRAHSGHVTCLDFSSRDLRTGDGHEAPPEAAARLLLSSSFDKTVQVHRFPEMVRILAIDAHTDAITSCHFHPTLAGCASCSSDGVIKVWRLDGKLVTSLRRIAIADAGDRVYDTAHRVPTGATVSPQRMRMQHERSGLRTTSPVVVGSRRVSGQRPPIVSPRGRGGVASSPSPSRRSAIRSPARTGGARFAPPPHYANLVWCGDGESVLSLEECRGRIRRVGVGRAALSALPAWDEMIVDERVERAGGRRRASDAERSHHQQPTAVNAQSKPSPGVQGGSRRTVTAPQIRRAGYSVTHHSSSAGPAAQEPPAPESTAVGAEESTASTAAETGEKTRVVSARLEPDTSQQARSLSPAPRSQSPIRFNFAVSPPANPQPPPTQSPEPVGPAEAQFASHLNTAASTTTATATNTAADERPHSRDQRSPASAAPAADWLSKCGTNLGLLCQVGLGPFDPHAARICQVEPDELAADTDTGAVASRPASPRAVDGVDALAELRTVIDAHTRLNLRAAVALTGSASKPERSGEEEFQAEREASPFRESAASFAPVDGGRAPSLRSEHRKRLAAAGALREALAARPAGETTPVKPDSDSADRGDRSPARPPPTFHGRVHERVEAIAPCFAPKFTAEELKLAADAASACAQPAALLLAHLPCLATAHHPWNLSRGSDGTADVVGDEHDEEEYPAERFALWSACHRALAGLPVADGATEPAPHGCGFLIGAFGTGHSEEPSPHLDHSVELHSAGGDPLAPLLLLTSLQAARARLAGAPVKRHEIIIVVFAKSIAGTPSPRRFIESDSQLYSARTSGHIAAALGCVGQGALAAYPAGFRFIFRGTSPAAVSSFVSDAVVHSWAMRELRNGASVTILEEPGMAQRAPSPHAASPPHTHASPTRATPIGEPWTLTQD